MTTEELRQIALDGDRALHLRRLGTGRPVVLLHESPRSSAVLLPLATRLADRFTVFALDSPGYGSSDPLAMRRPEITDFADAVARSLRDLGLGRVPVYGTHTGATIAAELGRRHPDLVAGLVLDGYPVFTRQERELHHTFYLVDFPPRWHGGHVVELWSRIRDQFDFFPWYLPGESARLPPPKADLARHRAVLRDFLLAGETYAAAYAASFRFDGREALEGQRIPIRILARRSDLLFSHLDRLGTPPGDCKVSEVSTDPDAWAGTIAGMFDAMPGDRTAPAPRTDRLSFGPSGVLGVIGARMLVRCYGSRDVAGDAPVLLLHDSPGCAEDLHDLAQGLAAGRRVVVPELPNHGRSCDLDPVDPVSDLLGLLGTLAEQTGRPPMTVVGQGAGAILAHLFGLVEPARVTRIIQVAPRDGEGRRDAARLPPRMDGADLVERWYALRDDLLMGSDGAWRDLGVGIDIGGLHRKFVASLLALGLDRTLAAEVRVRLASIAKRQDPIMAVAKDTADVVNCLK